MKNNIVLATIIASSFWLVGCTFTPTQNTTTPSSVAVNENNKTNFTRASHINPEDLIKITGIGFGAEVPFSNVTQGQRRLLAIRASKLDAYRSLAEQIHGIKIDSNTAISALSAKNDSFRARVSGIVRGARVISVTPMADNNYETILEVYVHRDFFNENFVYR